jgi:hypothetical protein
MKTTLKTDSTERFRVNLAYTDEVEIYDYLHDRSIWLSRIEASELVLSLGYVLAALESSNPPEDQL